MIKENHQKLLNDITEACCVAGRNPEEVKLVAVTKRIPLEKIREATHLGVNNLGENRIQEAVSKIKQIPEPVDWHFIGHLQTNKVGNDLSSFCLIHSLDRLKLAKKLEDWASSIGKTVNTLVQMNVSGESSKFGLAPEELKDFLLELKSFNYVKAEGLMTMAPLVENPENTRPFFRRLRELRDQANRIPGISLCHLSMGMSNDFRVAVEEGATLVRVGTALFGPRE